LVKKEVVAQASFTTVRCDRNLLDEAYFKINTLNKTDGYNVKMNREEIVELALKDYLKQKKL
jgi:hypothetical protein